ncbi:small subunit processome component 20 homolog [Patella vulgata]|uniref:small subunit processome component 20 homolog n=1 Tax=Patella vulgata TaxID=6465 RepID=UPI0024A7DB47|nr:small subunit processome component 20 homolog [Patella vulgata]
MGKKDQTFRYKSFTDRISKINIDVIRKIRHKDDTITEESTYFYEAIRKWVDLDCTEDFYKFRCVIANQFQSFEQLVHNEENIVAGLKEHLQVPNSMAMESLLDLVVQLARDLQSDFYKHFKDFLFILTNLLKTYRQDPTILEKIFTTLAYLFKFLWRYLVKDIQEVYGFFSVLLHGKQRDFIKDFASESFSFLLRKVPDQNKLLNFLFKSLKQSPETSEGLGKLLFEVIKGVNHQFHSISEQLLPILFYKLGPWNPDEKKCKLPWKLVDKSVTFFMAECLEYTKKEYSEILWSTLLDTISKVHIACTKSNDEEQKTLCCQLARQINLLTMMIKCKNGGLMISTDKIGDVLNGICKSPADKTIIASSLLSCISTLLTNTYLVSSTQSLISNPFKQSFPLQDLVIFTKTLTKLHMFEKDVLPNLLLYINSHFTTMDEDDRNLVVQILVDIILQKSVLNIEDGSDILKLKLYKLYSKYSDKYEVKCVYEYMIKYLKTSCKDINKQTLYRLWSFLICLPNICSDVKQVVSICTMMWNSLFKVVNKINCGEKKDKMLFIMNQVLVNYLLLCKDDKSCTYTDISWSQILQLIKAYPQNVLILRLGDLYLSQAAQDGLSVINDDNLLKLFDILQPNLAHWSHKIRLLSLHILSIFPVKLPVVEEEIEQMSVLEICLSAERTPASVQKYRERIVHLQKLDYNLVHNFLPIGPFNKVPLLYLIGNLFCNLTLLWEKVRTLISTHAENMDTSEFWKEFKQQLDFASLKSEQSLVRGRSVGEEGNDLENEEVDDNLDLYMDSLFENHVTFCKEEDRQPDFTIFRLELWKAMQQFPEVCESQIDDIGDMVLKFIKDEYFPTDVDKIPSQNIKYNKREHKTSDDEDDDEDGDAVEEEDENENTDQQKIPFSFRRKNAASKSLVTHLQLLALFTKPKKMRKHPQLLDLYTQFLQHQDPEIQTIAFKCLLCYKFKYITPYKDHILNILNNTTFKEELIVFGLDEEITIIKTEHRKDILPLLLRILFGKMLSKARKDGSGRIKDTLRKDMIFRFLSGCTEDELEFYLKLVFSPITHFITDNPLDMVRQVEKSLDLTTVIPLKKLKALLGMMDVVIKNLSQRLDFYVPSLYRMILGLYTMFNTILNQSTNVRHAVLDTVRTCRHVTLVRLTQVFEEFDKYDYTASDIDALFETIVWPKLVNLNNDTTSYVTPLLSLFNIWSKNPRYFYLLRKEHPDNKGMTPLSQIFHLLNKENIDIKISQLIMNMVYQFLYYGENNTSTELDADEEEMDTDSGSEEEESLGQHRPDEEEMEIVKKEGIELLLPHITDIFQYLHNIVKRNSKTIRKKGDSVELKILQRICGYISDKTQCASLCSLLLSFFSKKKKSTQEGEENLLESVQNLLNVVDQPTDFYRQVSDLFFIIGNRSSRQMLCNIFKLVCTTPIADIVIKLNSWNPKRTDEPDYRVRLDAFSSYNTMVKDATSLDCDFLLPVIQNCCYFINSEDDMSLRDSSINCLTVIIKQMALINVDKTVYQTVINQIIIPRVKHGLIAKTDIIQHEYISLWGVLVEQFPHDPVFSELQDLKDPSMDLDFFETIRHIQLQKKAIAVRRLQKYLETHTPSSGVINHYFLPIISRFIIDESYGKQNDLVDSAVETLGVICKQLPWTAYYQQLKQYLQLLIKSISQQKLFVRVISVILKSFHFNLSKSLYKPPVKPFMGNPRPNKKFKGKGKKDEEDKNPMVDDLDDEATEEKGSEDLVELGPKNANKKSDMEMCTEELATEIHRKVVKEMIPWLHKVLTQRAKSETQHKSQRSSFARDDEVLRVPLALAMVKLLQTLPHKILEVKLPGVLSRVCLFLKSRAKEIRENARATLCKICVALGPRYFSFVLKQMKSVLVKGYQRHVLCYSVHKLLVHISPKLKAGDLQPALEIIQEIFIEEMFGKVAEEKEVEAITNQVFEAKYKKGPESFFIISQFLRPKSLNQLIAPLKEKLETTSSHKIAQKVRDVLEKVSMGLLINTSLNVQTLMIFVHGLTADNLAALEDTKLENKIEENKHEGERPPSCLLLPDNVPHGITKSKLHKHTNIHIIVEFGLHLLVNCLKKLDQNKEENLQLLDPLVSTISDCLFSKHILVNTYSLRCVTYILRFPLPSLKKFMRKIANGMFILLKNYASAGAARGQNSELVNMCFKAVTVLVRDVSFYNIDKDQLQVLLSFCEEDLLDYNRQSTAFSLLKAILSRKIDVVELHDLMKKLEDISITSEIPSTRLQSRQLVLQYLLDYPLGRNINNHIQYFVAQLQFDRESGRESALEMIATMIAKFPPKLLCFHAGMFFVPMAATMVNDDSEKCRKLTAICLKALLEKVELKKKNELFSITMTWLKDNKVQHRSLAAQLLGLFVEIEGEGFDSRLTEVLPLIKQQIDPTRYEEVGESVNKDVDSSLYRLLNTLAKIIKVCPILRDKTWQDDMNTIWEHVENHLEHPHNWVRLIAAQLYGLLFGAWTPQEISDFVDKPDGKETDHYFSFDTENKLINLVCLFCNQMRSEYLDDDLITQISKNMLYMGKIFKLISRSEPVKDDKDDIEEAAENEGDDPSLTLSWLVAKMINEANEEIVAKFSKDTIKRNGVIKWIAALSLELESDQLSAILPIIMPLLQRESVSGLDVELKQLADEVLNMIKKKIPIETFSKVYAAIQNMRTERRVERKRKRAVQMITNPAFATSKKIRKNVDRKKAKKRQHTDSIYNSFKLPKNKKSKRK